MLPCISECSKKVQIQLDLQVVLVKGWKQMDPSGYEDTKNKILTTTIDYQELL